jgi:hypothetical protein
MLPVLARNAMVERLGMDLESRGPIVAAVIIDDAKQSRAR